MPAVNSPTVGTYPANGIALERGQVIVVNKVRFRELIRRQPGHSLHVLGAISLQALGKAQSGATRLPL